MPRRSRIDLPGTIHHITIRGVDRMRIFRDDEDAADLLARFQRWTHETRSQCLAWSFNVNHAHWVIARRERSLAELMARFTSAYAQRFNRRHGRVGPLFQGRYKSRVIRGEDDLRWMALYALANPVRHGITEPNAIVDYAWSGWSAALGKRAPHSFESVEVILRLFGETDDDARRNLRDGLNVAVATKWRPPWRVQLERIIDTACRRQGIPRDEFSRSSIHAHDAQADAARLAIRVLGLKWRVVAAQLGVPQSRIARALRSEAPPQSGSNPEA